MTRARAVAVSLGLVAIVSAPWVAALSFGSPFLGPVFESAGRGSGSTCHWVAVTRATLRVPGRIGFFIATRRILASLPRQPGYQGHAVRVRGLGSEAATITVWRDEGSLDAFVESEVHARAMRQSAGAIASVRTRRASFTANEIPRTWIEVETLLQPSTRPGACSPIREGN